MQLEPFRAPRGIDRPGGDEEQKGDREAADNLGLIFALGTNVQERDRGEGENRVEPGNRARGLEEGDDAHDEVDIDEDGDDALEERLGPLDQGDDDDGQDKNEEQRAVMLMRGEERVHALTLGGA